MVVDAGADSMGGVVDGGVEFSSAPSPPQLSDLEKTQAELRETFSAAERFRRELEFLQKGGDPLDLKVGNTAPVSLQSTSLTDHHPEQFVTSEVKGSFAVTASPHGDSVESSDKLGAPSVGEPNSADNLMLFDGDNKFCEVEKRSVHPRINNTTLSDVALDIPKKSYKRRVRSRPNRDGVRASIIDAGLRSGHPFFITNSKPKSPVAHKTLASNSRLDIKSNGIQTPKSTLSPAYGQPLTSGTQEARFSMCSAEQGSVGNVEQEILGSEHPSVTDTLAIGNLAIAGQLDDCNSGEPLVKHGFESKSSCSQTNNDDELVASVRSVNSKGTMELNLASLEAPKMERNDINTVKDDKILNTANDNSNPCPPSDNDNGFTLIEEDGPKGSESTLQIDGLEENACSQNNVKLANKEHEDSILDEARIIEEKRKMIAGLSIGIFSSESNLSHWHFVLEEMSWLANDFAQERLWKANAAAQISRKAAYNSQVRFQQQNQLWKQKEVAHMLADAVMGFWHTLQMKCCGLELEGIKTDTSVGVHQYGMRFLEYNKSSIAHYSSAQVHMCPDRIADLGIVDIFWEDNLTEENLFYTVPPGAIEAYRKSIESHLLQCERAGSSMQEEVDATGYDAVAAFKLQDDMYEEDEEETSTYYLPGALEGVRSAKPPQKKRKHFRSYGPRSHEMGPDLSFMQSHERNLGTQPSVLSGKRPASSMNVSIPTKRVRTASRPRFTGISGFVHAPNRADASSGDTNSLQDEHSSLHGGSHIPTNMEAESGGGYEKQLHFDFTEVSNRPKKKKKTKHPGSVFEHQWQLDSNIQNDQKDHSKRRLDTRQLDYNGNSVASPTSNMSNPNKFMKLLAHDRGRKAKSLKTPAGQQGSEIPWSLFEDQALVVLVHDMGANWELISDAINSTLQFKCISRNSKECKERHKILMDRTGDGADSVEDSRSSQPYPSTLPGIPEGSARQLFQRLQGPMEEDTLKSHFEKIIMIWQKQHYKKAQKDNHDPKQLQQPHASHALALSQVYPNNLNGGDVLTPLDLCDTVSPSTDFVTVGYQGPHTAGLPIPNHGVPPMVPGSTSTSSQPGSSAMVLGSHLASVSAPLSPSVREGRFGIPRGGSLSIDEQHRMQQLNQMSGRNIQQSSLHPGSHSGTDRGVRILPGGTSMGVINGMHRSRAMARPGFQGTSSPSMLTPANMHSGVGPGQGNSVRPREALHMMRPNQNMALDLQMQQQVSHGGMSSFPNQNTQPHVQSYPYPMSPQQSPHMPNSNSRPHHPPHPAYGGMHFIKERQLPQQRLLQQQFATSNPMMPPVQPQQSQVPVSSPQSSLQVQSQSSPPIGTPSIKHPVAPPHGLMRNPQTGGNHTMKQQPRLPQQFQPPGRQHAHQTAKVITGGGRGTVIHQNIPAASSHLNGLSGSESTPHSSLNHLQQQRRYPTQPQAASSKQLHSDSSNNPSAMTPLSNTSPVMMSSNHRQLQPLHKLGSQIQATGQRIVQNRKDNSSELPTSKVQAREAAQTSEQFEDSSGPVLDKVPTGLSRSPPHSFSTESGGERSRSAVNHDSVCNQSESDSLANFVQQEHQPSS